MGWLMGCRVIVMRVRWAGVGWFVARDTWSGWCMLEEGLCVDLFGLFWAAIINVLFLDFVFMICFCMQCLQKTWENIWCFSVWFSSNTILLLFSFNFNSSLVWLFFVLLGVLLTGFDWPNNKWMAGGTGARHVYPNGNLPWLTTTATYNFASLFLVGGHFCFLGQWQGQQQHNSFVCLLDIFSFLLHSQTYTVLLWPWQSPSVGF